jgi:CTP:molybdopterin cytidylyltransferase MocA
MAEVTSATQWENQVDRHISVAAVITAGWNPKEGDPLAAYAQGGPKALIPVAGQPMINHVVDALAGSCYIKHFVIVSLAPSAGALFSVPVDYLPDAGGLVDNVRLGIEYAVDRYPDVDAALLCGSDIPTITSSIVDGFIHECFRTEHDVYYSIIERSVMETRFPASRRSYVHLRDGDFAGGDLLLFRPSITFDHQELLRKLATARKSALRQARMLGPEIFYLYVTRRLSLAEAERRARKVFDVRLRAVPSPHAEVGMDVDKPFQLEIVRAELEARAAD